MRSSNKDRFEGTKDINRIIGTMMGEKEGERWGVVSSHGGISISREGFASESYIREWFADQCRRFPSWAEATGSQVQRLDAWEDYLPFDDAGNATTRFLDWAFRQPALAGVDVASLLAQAEPGVRLPDIVAGLILAGASKQVM